MTEVSQVQLVDRLRHHIPKKGDLVKILTELLSISPDSVYRLLRGESEFTLSEVVKIAHRFDLSMDNLYNERINSTTFHYNKLYNRDNAFEPYFVNLTQQMERLRRAEGKLYFVCSELPISQSFQNQELREFKLFYWQRVILNRQIMRGIKYDKTFAIGFNLNQYVDSLMDSYRHIDKTEIWTEETLDDTIRQLKYCRDCGLMDHENLLNVCQSLIHTLNRLENELESQTYSDDPHRLRFYVSSVELGNNVIHMNYGQYRTSYIKFNTFNTVATRSDDFCDEIEHMIEGVLAKSVEISGRSDVLRHRFFTTLRSKVEALMR